MWSCCQHSLIVLILLSQSWGLSTHNRSRALPSDCAPDSTHSSRDASTQGNFIPSRIQHTPLPFAPVSRKVSANKIYLQHQRSSRIPALRQRKKDQNGISVQTWRESQLPWQESSPILWVRQLNIEGKACSSSDYVEQKLIEGISLRLGSPFIFSTAHYMGVGIAVQTPAGKADPSVAVISPLFICFSG